uniref:DNA-directed RNA polymerase n=1 Tax=Borodinellopsis insignis TaxID=3229915 RepID=A0AB39U497_9CHLO
MPIHRFFISDFVEIQRKSFLTLLETGLINEFSKRNPITNAKKDIELFFYPEYYRLTPPEHNPYEAILKGVSYTTKLYIPVQLTDKKSNSVIIKLKWCYIGNLPLMTKRGHFILNGAARVIVNQILRSPGIYYQQKLYEAEIRQQKQKPEKKSIVTYKRYYADLICLRGTWLRIEIDKDKNIWAQTKKGPKIPIFWLLLAMGLTERLIFKSILEPNRLIQNLENFKTSKKIRKDSIKKQTKNLKKNKNKNLIINHEVAHVFPQKSLLGVGDPENLTVPHSPLRSPLTHEVSYANTTSASSPSEAPPSASSPSEAPPSEAPPSEAPPAKLPPSLLIKKSLGKKSRVSQVSQKNIIYNSKKGTPSVEQRSLLVKNPPEAWKEIYSLMSFNQKKNNLLALKSLSTKRMQNSQNNKGTYFSISSLGQKKNLAELGRKWLFNKFMNHRTYDLGKQGRLTFNKKLGLNISSDQLTLTPQDLLYATDYLIKVEKGFKTIDDIDHLKNRRVRTSGELIQIQIGTGLVRLEKSIRERMNKSSTQYNLKNNVSKNLDFPTYKTQINKEIQTNPTAQKLIGDIGLASNKILKNHFVDILSINNLINSKAFNSALREFFGTSPLSQFMDQINPLAEITHKRRLSSMGPGGVTRDSATLAIRGIHPTHYGRICPIETPEGKNTGLVNSMTAYARVNYRGIIESPFYKVYKGQVQKTAGIFYLSAEHEEKIKLAAADLFTSSIGFLPKSSIPVRIGEDFTKIPRDDVQYIGVSPIQMISIATSLIPFLEHDDANRALMGSNMQRQAVPLLRPEKPIVGTGLEARAVSDSGHVIQSKMSGLVTYVSGSEIMVTTFRYSP